MKKQLGVITANAPHTAGYAREVLAHAGLFPSPISKAELASVREHYAIILLAGEVDLADDEREALADFVTDGGALIGVGGLSGLETVFGAEKAPIPLAVRAGLGGHPGLGEGYVDVRRKTHPVVRDLESSLHTFGGVAVRATKGTSLAKMRDAFHRKTDNDAIVENRLGRGLALLLAPDLFASIVRIQQGTYVDQDAIPPLDGSAPTNDGILKCEDGLTLSHEWDRTAVDGDNPVFYHPVADELRELVTKSVLYVAQRRRVPLAMLWYYPRNLPALGHVSHDTDGNKPDRAWSLLKAVQENRIKTTWCTIEPGYSTEFYDALKADGCEIALHYDALDGRPRTSWGEHQLIGQHAWLTRAAGVSLVSNKNHYTRWEGRLEFFRWCASLGIQCDQTKGPSKLGTIGYPFGGAHPWFPIDDDGTTIDCLELNLQTQDLIVTCPGHFGAYWVDQAARHHGIAHYLFHPAHIDADGVARALKGVVDRGREMGLEWWTCAQINAWERARRSVRLESCRRRRGGRAYRFASDTALKDATLLFLDPRAKDECVERYGFSFRKVIADLDGEGEVEV